jgi:hypothetical protein
MAIVSAVVDVGKMLKTLSKIEIDYLPGGVTALDMDERIVTFIS